MRALVQMKITEGTLKDFNVEVYNCVTQDKTILLLPTLQVEWWYGFTLKFGFLFWIVQLEYNDGQL